MSAEKNRTDSDNPPRVLSFPRSEAQPSRPYTSPMKQSTIADATVPRSRRRGSRRRGGLGDHYPSQPNRQAPKCAMGGHTQAFGTYWRGCKARHWLLFLPHVTTVQLDKFLNHNLSADFRPGTA